MTDGTHDNLEALIRRAIRASDFEVPPATLSRAVGLSRLLPQPSEGGLRAWFDRAIARLARPTFDEPAHALHGVRRLSGPRARGWEGTHATVELEIADVVRSGATGAQGAPGAQGATGASGAYSASGAASAPGTIAVRGLITQADGSSPGPCAIAALDHDGRLAMLATSDSEGHFVIELAPVVRALAIATPHETILLDNVVAPPGADQPSGHAG